MKPKLLEHSGRRQVGREWPVWFAVLVWGLLTLLFFSFAYWLTKR